VKVICINVSNRKKNQKEKLFYTRLNIKQDNDCFWELTIPLDSINKRVFEYNKGIIPKLKGVIWDRKVLAKIKSLENDMLYLLPKFLDKEIDEKTATNSIKSHVVYIMEKAGAKLYTYSGDIKKNIYKYIDQELARQKVNFADAKLLVLYEDYKNINYTLLEEMAKKYKIIDILCKNGDYNIVEEKVEKINNTLGCSIIVKNKITKKDIKLSQYNLNVCMDANRNKFGLNNASIIDLSDNDMDKYDKYAVCANKNKLYKKINSEYLTYMSKNYGRLKILSLLCKTENLA